MSKKKKKPLSRRDVEQIIGQSSIEELLGDGDDIMTALENKFGEEFVKTISGQKPRLLGKIFAKQLGANPALVTTVHERRFTTEDVYAVTFLGMLTAEWERVEGVKKRLEEAKRQLEERKTRGPELPKLELPEQPKDPAAKVVESWIKLCSDLRQEHAEKAAHAVKEHVTSLAEKAGVVDKLLKEPALASWAGRVFRYAEKKNAA